MKIRTAVPLNSLKAAIYTDLRSLYEGVSKMDNSGMAHAVAFAEGFCRMEELPRFAEFEIAGTP